jgi:hypothetical protein
VKDINERTNESRNANKGEGRKEEERKIGRKLESSKNVWECIHYPISFARPVL